MLQHRRQPREAQRRVMGALAERQRRRRQELHGPHGRREPRRGRRAQVHLSAGLPGQWPSAGLGLGCSCRLDFVELRRKEGGCVAAWGAERHRGNGRVRRVRLHAQRPQELRHERRGPPDGPGRCPGRRIGRGRSELRAQHGRRGGCISLSAAAAWLGAFPTKPEDHAHGRRTRRTTRRRRERGRVGRKLRRRRVVLRRGCVERLFGERRVERFLGERGGGDHRIERGGAPERG